MQKMIFLLVLVALALTFNFTPASADFDMGYQHYYNWLRDDDGDGIPNHLDDDWTPPEDGTGYQMKHGFKRLIANGGDIDDGAMYQHNYRYQVKDSKSTGSFLRFMKRLRDGSCE